MSHEAPTVTAQLREKTGSRYAHRLRKNGHLPAVIYGHKTDPVSISVDEKVVLGYLHEGMHVFNMEVEGGEKQTCLVKDIQFGYLGDNVIHLDLTRVDLDEEVTVNVGIHFVGEPKAAKVPGAVVSHPLNELEVICKVSAIPDQILVDVSDMVEVYTVGDIELPAGVRTDIDPETPVATITYIAEEEAEGEEVEVGDEAAEPEVISAKDDEDGDDEKKDDA
ncbi:MAG: 50S ribosomal protein L25 [Phycisphaerales bacterium]|nr:MAG: 50S ribosomal protein L25 [Phycisphaerales bacterium]